MKRILPVFLVVFGLTILGVMGCEDGYSEAVKYTLRTDPIIIKPPVEERTTPDRPGQLPVMSVADIVDPLNPLSPEQRGKAGDDPFMKSGFIDPTTASDADRAMIKEALDSRFGTPAHPKVEGFEADDDSVLQLAPETLARGSRLYRIHCLHCHGVTGDGRGPTAKWVNPHPRDYRQGAFKFTSVVQVETQSPPARQDIIRIIRNGAEGTAMPAHILLPGDEIEALASYVTHLGIRGQTEFMIFREAFDSENGVLVRKSKVSDDDSFKDFVGKIFSFTVRAWTGANENLIPVEDYPKEYLATDSPEFKQSVYNGKELFLGKGEEGKKANCVQCHIDYGRNSKFRFDMWGTMAKPNNFTLGVFRGGRRPVDLYYRIHSGILPSGMAAFGNPPGTKKGEEKKLTGRQIWDLINFVQVLSSPSMQASLELDINGFDRDAIKAAAKEKKASEAQ